MSESNESHQELSINNASVKGQVGQAGHTLNQMQVDFHASTDVVIGRSSPVYITSGNITFQHERGQFKKTYLDNRQAKVGIPSLLPYLPNRTEQETELHKSLQVFTRKALAHPFVCIVHGDEYQCHDKFLERLQKVSLPNFLGSYPLPVAITEYQLDYPTRSNDLSDLSDILGRNLSNSLREDANTSLEEINKILGQHINPVIVHTHVLTENWMYSKAEILDKLLEFWQNWPELMPDQRLIVCIFIKYQVKRNRDSGFLWPIQLFRYAKLFFRRRQYQKINRKIHRYLEGNKASNFQKFNRLTCVALPELTDVSRGHVESWVRSEDTKQFVGEAAVERLIGAVREEFDQWEELYSCSTMPMDDLANRLFELLKKTAKGELP